MISEMEGRTVKGYFLEAFNPICPGKCALECYKNKECRSLSFWDARKCELYREDVFSTTEGEIILGSKGNCTCFGMKQKPEPRCQKDGVYAGITNGENPEGCQMNGKRVDHQCGAWYSLDDINNDTEWRLLLRRDRIADTAHGGVTGAAELDRLIGG